MFCLISMFFCDGKIKLMKTSLISRGGITVKLFIVPTIPSSVYSLGEKSIMLQ